LNILIAVESRIIINQVKQIDFTVTGVKNIKSMIIPFFLKYNIRGVKALDFSDFCKIVSLMDQGVTFN
jgi:hypothetical protein